MKRTGKIFDISKNLTTQSAAGESKRCTKIIYFRRHPQCFLIVIFSEFTYIDKENSEIFNCVRHLNIVIKRTRNMSRY